MSLSSQGPSLTIRFGDQPMECVFYKTLLHQSKSNHIGWFRIEIIHHRDLIYKLRVGVYNNTLAADARLQPTHHINGTLIL